MGFLDNSGDIILDAVLTDIGRKRMAEGNFRIVKYSPGDDEIDYSLYNADHTSGSAYYDLEMKFIVEAGEFDILVGNSSRDEDLKNTSFSIEESIYIK